jgi:hypothetical protein
MRTAILLLMIAGTVTAAELEQITLTDGRRFIGYYDQVAGTLTVEGPPKAVIRVTGGQIAARAPYIRPIDTDPAKRDEAELVRLEAEHAAAIGEAERLRKFAGSRSGRDAEVATSQANERAAQAEKLAEQIAALKARVIARKPKPEPTVATPASRQEQARQAAGKALAEAFALRDQAAAKEFEALVDLLKSIDLEEKEIPELGPDPRKSEVEQRERQKAENERRLNLRIRLEEAPQLHTAESKERWSTTVLRLLNMPNESEARRVEREEAERRAQERRSKARAGVR